MTSKTRLITNTNNALSISKLAHLSKSDERVSTTEIVPSSDLCSRKKKSISTTSLLQQLHLTCIRWHSPYLLYYENHVCSETTG